VPGKYSLLKNSPECIDCPDNAECPGNSTLILNAGYWRINIDSDIILQCENNQLHCTGGDS